MKELRHGFVQSAIEQELPGGGLQEVLAPDNLSDLHRAVIGNHRQLIGRDVVMAPNHEISKISSRDEFLGTVAPIVEANSFSIRDAKTPVDPGGVRQVGQFVFATGARVDRIGFACVRRLRRSQHILAGAGAWVNETAGAQLFEHLPVSRFSLALGVRTEWTTPLRAFIPFKPKPTQIVIHCSHELRFATVAIQVFVSQDQNAALGAGTLLRGPERSGMAEMQVPGRRWGEPASVGCILNGLGCHNF